MIYTPENLLFEYRNQFPGTLEEYAALLDATYVRSQVQLALAEFGGTGHKFKAGEAIDAFGVGLLLQAIRNGSTPLIPSAQEPSSTLLRRREALNVSRSDLARRTGLTEQDITLAETPGKVTPVRDLEKIAQHLGLDDHKIGVVPASGGDASLGVRLRELAGGDARRFTPAVVLALAEAAWVVSRQLFLSKKLGLVQHSILSEAKSSNYNYPIWERGYELAERTRRKLGLYNDEPIESLRILIEDKLGIPLIQLQLDQRFAGATISNGSDRGIVVNECGQNENVCMRRMTMCHELGHLLWDPNERLNTLSVDDYDTLSNLSHDAEHDEPEKRANAFAVAFLAPREAVRSIAKQYSDLGDTVRQVAERFRISATAARYHVCNVLGYGIERVAGINVPPPLSEWVVSENLILDYFPIEATPISRQGKFARLVARACIDGIISTDSAALLLECSSDGIQQKLNKILELMPLDVAVD